MVTLRGGKTTSSSSPIGSARKRIRSKIATRSSTKAAKAPKKALLKNTRKVAKAPRGAPKKAAAKPKSQAEEPVPVGKTSDGCHVVYRMKTASGTVKYFYNDYTQNGDTLRVTRLQPQYDIKRKQVSASSVRFS